MSWRYIATVKDGGWEIHEFYDATPAIPKTGWTADETPPHGDTREELIQCLRNMLSDVESGEYLDYDAEVLKHV